MKAEHWVIIAAVWLGLGYIKAANNQQISAVAGSMTGGTAAPINWGVIIQGPIAFFTS